VILISCPNIYFSAEQLLDIGCKWVILGHSERRHIIGEDNQVRMWAYTCICMLLLFDLSGQINWHGSIWETY
jgi:Triosephosphate isomerase